MQKHLPGAFMNSNKLTLNFKKQVNIPFCTDSLLYIGKWLNMIWLKLQVFVTMMNETPCSFSYFMHFFWKIFLLLHFCPQLSWTEKIIMLVMMACIHFGIYHDKSIISGAECSDRHHPCFLMSCLQPQISVNNLSNGLINTKL